MNNNVLFAVLLATFWFSKSFGQLDKSFLDPPMLIQDLSSNERYSLESRRFTGIPSLAVSKKGQLWAVWYTGKTPKEDQNNYVVVATSRDNGKSWKEVLVIDPDGTSPVRAFDPEVWVDPDGKLWVFGRKQ